MDVYSLVAAHLAERVRPQRPSERDEQRYYAQADLPRLPPGLVTSVAMLAGVVMLLLVGGHAF